MFAKIPAASVLADTQKDYPYRDSHVRPVHRDGITADDLIAAFLATPPRWVDTLMSLRDTLAGRLGLKTSTPRDTFPKMPFHVGQQLGIFRVLHLLSAEAVLGENDRHLDFQISLLADNGKLTVSTLVRPHNIFGILYLVCVLPFHYVIASAMIRRMESLLNEK